MALLRTRHGQVLDEDGAVMAEEALRELRTFLRHHEAEIATSQGDFRKLRRTFLCVCFREPEA